MLTQSRRLASIAYRQFGDMFGVCLLNIDLKILTAFNCVNETIHRPMYT
ncbi:hypothetical protein SAMN03159306_00654 [Pseudomonas sp. NFACC48-1]|nr:hypothetical protein SAMN03159405_05896 [Pseudomonas sp. NFACC44-2]SDY25884.1 hypothetical protein SAMN03159474_05020 [Pseudomonas sp. NFACC08-1]SFH86133.1 hypothetical protein SAMN03159302_02811 [Pseudomonas sp. NFACC54]SFS49434.1 hypothetical protein SAMN03159306_00654 [Pseudomonas sp. NFACC48-1]